MNNAARFSGTPDQALAILRAEWSHIDASIAARMNGERPKRDAELQRALSAIDGGYAQKLGALLAATPKAMRGAIDDAFAQVLPVEVAAKMRGAAAGTWYRFEAWIDGRAQPSRQMQTDERGARELAAEAEQDALASGALDVRVVWHLMNADRRAA